MILPLTIYEGVSIPWSVRSLRNTSVFGNFLVPQCFVAGECRRSSFIRESVTLGENSCLHFCQQVTGCQWFTYDPNDSVCMTFSDCNELVIQDCPHCLSGQVNLFWHLLSIFLGSRNLISSQQERSEELLFKSLSFVHFRNHERCLRYKTVHGTLVKKHRNTGSSCFMTT